MATRCAIGFVEYDGSIEAIYCHWDGYIRGGVGDTLFEHYNTLESVEALIELGDISVLGETLDTCEVYNKRSQNYVSARAFQNHFYSSGCEYLYLFDGKKWSVARGDTFEDTIFERLAEATIA